MVPPTLSPATPTRPGSGLRPTPRGGYAPGSGADPGQLPPPPGGYAPGSGRPSQQLPPPPGGFVPGSGRPSFQLPPPSGGYRPGAGIDPFRLPPPSGGYLPGSGADPFQLGRHAQYWGEWGVLDVGGGRVGPFDTIEEAFEAAVDAAVAHGAKEMPLDGFAQVADEQGEPVGPII